MAGFFKLIPLQYLQTDSSWHRCVPVHTNCTVQMRCRMITQSDTVQLKADQQFATFRVPLQFFRRRASFFDTSTELDVSKGPPSRLLQLASIWHVDPDTLTLSRVQLEAALDSENAPLQSTFLGGDVDPA